MEIRFNQVASDVLLSIYLKAEAASARQPAMRYQRKLGLRLLSARIIYATPMRQKPLKNTADPAGGQIRFVFNVIARNSGATSRGADQ